MKKIIILFMLLFNASCTTPETVQVPEAIPPTSASTLKPSPAPTFSPTATVTPPPPTPLPRFFREEFMGELPDWSVLQSNVSSTPLTYLQDGSLFFELDFPYQWVYTIIGNAEYGNVRIDASLKSMGSGLETLGVVCRYSEANGWYEFNISGDASYNVLFGQWLAEGVAQYSPIASDYSEYIQRGGGPNEVGLGCQDDTLWLYINGKLFRKLDVSRFGLTEGKLGLAAASFENIPVIGAFDWLKVSEP